MTTTQVIQATLLYETLPAFPEEKLRSELRALAGRSNLSTAGETSYRDGVFRLIADPYEITVEPVDATLPAASFSGALSGHINGNLRRPLASVVAEHRAHIRIGVRDLLAEPDGEPQSARLRKATIFAQDVLRKMLSLLPPMALHWHPSNVLSLPAGLGSSPEGKLFLPLCLRMRTTSAPLADTSEVNMAQSIEGSDGIIGRPLHVMSTSLDRYETLDLAIAFISQCIEGDGGPVAGTVFRDKKGTRVEVVDHKPSAQTPDGLLALVELAPPAPRRSPPVDAISREAVAARVTSERLEHPRVTSRPLDRPKASLSEAQTEVVRRSLEQIDAKEAEAAQPPLPDRNELRRLRLRTAAQPRNTPGER